MSSARVDYIAPWWTYWLHNFPHISLRFQPTDNSFQPEDENYQQVSRGGGGGGWRMMVVDGFIKKLGERHRKLGHAQ